MSDFSIEQYASRITDVRSREYFHEAYLSYANGSFRSSIVMLWTVIVCDVLFKLEQLSQGYGDAVATQILTDVRAKQTANPNSPDWEDFLIESVHRKTELLDVAEFKNLQAIHSARHLCAHPILTGAYALATINQDTARAHIRNALEAVLTKPPFMSKKVFDTFMVDLESLGLQQPSQPTIDQYVSTKYLTHLRPTALKSLFRSLWRVVFKSADQRAEQNRNINLMALIAVFRSDRRGISTWIAEDAAYFSDISFGTSNIICLTQFLRQYPSIYPLLTEAAKTPLLDYSNKSIDHYACMWFTSPTTQSHIDILKQRILNGEAIRSDVFQVLAKSLETDLSHPTILDCGVALYGQSGNYNTADERFVAVIRPILNKLTQVHLGQLLNAIEANSQTYSRNAAYADHLEVKSVIDIIAPQFDLTPFPHFRHSIGMQ